LGGARRPLLAGLLLAPAVVLCLGVLAYPLVLEAWFSLTNASPGTNGSFVGLANFRFLGGLTTYHQMVANTAVYTVASTVAKAALGLGMALALNSAFPGRRLVYALLFLPFMFPVVMGTIGWYFLLTNVHGALDYLLQGVHVTRQPVDFLGTAPMASVVLVNVWHGSGLFGVLLLAGLRSIPAEVLDAASVEAAALRRFLHVTLPLLRPALLLATVLSVLGTFGDFAIVDLLTGGGPIGRTEIVSTFSFELALRAGDIGVGAAVAMSLVPVYVAALFVVLRLLRSR